MTSSIDPERPLIEESIYEIISRDKQGIFAKGLVLLNELAQLQGTGNRTELQAELLEASPSGMQAAKIRGRYRWYVLVMIGLGIAALIWLMFNA